MNQPPQALMIATLLAQSLVAQPIVLGIGAPLLAVLECQDVLGPDQLPKISAEQYNKWKQILANTMKMKIAISLNREVFFPHELATMTVIISNPGSQPLEVLEPVERVSGQLYIGAWSEVDGFGRNRRFEPQFGQSAKSRIIEAGETVTKSFRVGTYGSPDSFAGLPGTEGSYEFVYIYGTGASVKFKIANPRVELCVQEPDPRQFERDEFVPGKGKTGKRMKYVQYASGCVFEENGNWVIAVVPGNLAGPDGNMAHYKVAGPTNFPKMVRLIESKEPITSMALAPQADGKVIVSYATVFNATQVRTRHVIRLKSNREVEAQ